MGKTSLETKVAIITGGGSGIGREIALRFAREGATVVIPDINVLGAQETQKAIADSRSQCESRRRCEKNGERSCRRSGKDQYSKVERS
jgi:NAD(P)-dependent dehydrogenase (short-subunit alcohol dehydrogenase family)